MTVPADRRPVLVGVGQLRSNRERTPAQAREPLALILDAVQRAAQDAGGAELLTGLDAVLAVHCNSWAYESLAAAVARALGAAVARTQDAPIGGQWPLRLLEEACARIAAGESGAELVVGGEAQASMTMFTRAGLDPTGEPGWSAQPGGAPPLDPDDLLSDRMLAAGLFLPTRCYPLLDNRLQFDQRLTPQQNAAWTARIYAGLSDVAQNNPTAWSPELRTPEQVATVGPGNRMICEPYPLAVNPMPYVDQAAAVLVCSVGRARAAGVDPARMVHVRASATAAEPADLLDRETLGHSRALAEVLQVLDGDDPAELVDVYSCFPVVPKLAELALGRTDPLSVTGGHSSFGGPLSSYSVHALVAMVQRLRAGAGSGLVHANGGFLTHHCAVRLGRTPQPSGFQRHELSGGTGAAPRWLPPAEAVGLELSVESVTVEHGRDGEPMQAFVVARDPSGRRTAAATAPGDVAAAQAFSLDRLPAGSTTYVDTPVRLMAGGNGPFVAPADQSW